MDDNLIIQATSIHKTYHTGTVTVPAGTFSCLRLRRVDNDVGDERYWYAKGVGVVKEDDGVEQELLREYQIVD